MFLTMIDIHTIKIKNKNNNGHILRLWQTFKTLTFDTLIQFSSLYFTLINVKTLYKITIVHKQWKQTDLGYMSTRNKAMYYDLENRGPYIQTEVKISFSLYKLGYLKK